MISNKKSAQDAKERRDAAAKLRAELDATKRVRVAARPKKRKPRVDPNSSDNPKANVFPDHDLFHGDDEAATAPQAEDVAIGPQPGPQRQFLETTADIALYGGAAGGGKSYALLLEPLRHYENPKFGAVIFRRNSVQVRNEGGLWDESVDLYVKLNSHPREYALEHEFPSGARVKFAHLELDRSVYDWHGSQIAMIGFDELTHFTAKQFWYMLSRNRSASGVPAYMRATCNPDADSWVAKLIEWYIDQETGYAIPERSGVLRWLVRLDDALHWGDSKEELIERFAGRRVKPLSFTFIPSKLEDNQILLKNNPGYEAGLEALNLIERERLRYGNWKIKASAGNFFRKHWFEIIPAIPAGWINAVRFWDRAATKPSIENEDPDWTRGLLLYRYPNNTYVVADVRSLRDSPGKVEDLIKNTASHDGPHVMVRSQRDPGSAGVSEAHHFVTMLQGFDVQTDTESQNKETRAKSVSAQAEVGNIKVLRAPWNDEFLSELENFPEGAHDDQVDVLSGAYNTLALAFSILDVS